jgi:hypothetical protein
LLIVGLIGIWLLFRRNWKVIGRLALSRLGWLLLGFSSAGLGAEVLLMVKACSATPATNHHHSPTRLACAGSLDCALVRMH